MSEKTPKETFFETFKEKISPHLSIENASEREEFFSELQYGTDELKALGKDPIEALKIMENIGGYLAATTKENFTAEYQKFSLSAGELYAIQLPGGGNIYLLQTPAGKILIDTGYGCYYHDVVIMLKKLGLNTFQDVKSVIITHADADHCGASGYFSVSPFMHPITKKILDAKTRGFNSDPKLARLEKIYAQSINYLSKLHLPPEFTVCKTEMIKKRRIFPVIDEVAFGSLNFEVWESLGGHIAGQIFLYEPNEGLLFTSDALMHFGTLTEARKNFCSIADYLISSVNANSETAKLERHELMRIASELDESLKKKGKHLLICCGHGSVCKLDEKGMLTQASLTESYSTK